MPGLTDRDVSLLKVLLDRQVVVAEATERALHHGLPSEDGLAAFLTENGLVADASALERARGDVARAGPGDLLARIELEDQAVIRFLEQANVVDATQLDRARRFQGDLARRGRVRGLGTVLVDGGLLPLTTALQIRARVAECVQRCPSCSHYYVIEPADHPRRYRCRHCGGPIDLPAAPRRPGSSSGMLHPAAATPGSGRIAVSAADVDSGRYRAGRRPSDPALQTLTDSTVASARFSFADAVARDVAAQAAATEPGAQMFGPFVIREELGRGGMGVVYRATDRRTRQEVALKVLNVGLEANERQIRRFTREAEAASTLDHPGLVRVTEHGRVEGHHYLVMELVSGRSLDTYLAEKRHEPGWAAQVLAEVADAVAHAHDKGVLHRDLKPANILIDATAGRARVTDFGLARRLDDEEALTRTGAAIGTPYYMSPEQVSGDRDRMGPGSDIYSLGVILYEMLTGRTPFRAPTPIELYKMIAEQPPTPPSALRKTVPPALETIAMCCLEKDPADRYRDARELSRDLARFGRGEAVKVPLRNRAVRYVKRRRRQVATIAGATALVVLGAIVPVAMSGRLGRLFEPESAEAPPPPQPVESFEDVMRRAEEAAGRGDWSDAAVAYSRALEIGPAGRGAAGPHLGRATARERLGDWGGALADIERALAADPASIEALLARARLLREQNPDDPRAVDDLARAYDLAPERADILDAFVGALIASGQEERAMGLLDEGARAEGALPLSLACLRAEQLMAAGESAEALALLEDALSQPSAGAAPQIEVRAQVARARLLLGRDEGEDARRARDELEATRRRLGKPFASLPGALAALAEAYLRTHDTASALRFANEALVVDPGDVSARRTRAIVFVGDASSPTYVGKALADAEALLVADPSDPLALAMRASIVMDEFEQSQSDPRWIQGVRDLDRALGLAPGDPFVIYWRAFVASQMGDMATAGRLIERVVGPNGRPGVLAAFPGMLGMSNKLLGYALLTAGQFDGALTYLEKARRLVPGDVETAGMLFGLYKNLGRLQQAEAVLREAIQLKPTEPTPRVQLGLLYLESARHAEAKQLFDGAAVLSGSMPEDTLIRLRFGRGAALVRLGHAREGVELLQTVLSSYRRDACASYLLTGYLVLGDAEKAQQMERLLESMPSGPTVGMALIAKSYLMAGRREAAFDRLERAVANGLRGAARLRQDAEWRPVATEARFVRLMERMGER